MPKKIKADPDEQTAQPGKVYGDPEYSAEDDIYSREEKLELEDSGDGLMPVKGSAKGAAAKAAARDRLSEDLDVPGSEADDADEEIGEEDEENNYYSLGGDDHDDLEEDRGE